MPNLYRKLPPLNTLVAFEAAYRLKSFSRAADEIARSQASVSRQIRQLEESLGVSLFVRQRHDVQPTQEGDRYAATISLVLGELSRTTHELRTSSQGHDSFTIYSDISIASALVSPILSRFQHQHPHIQLKVLSSYESIEETGESFDLGLQVGRMAEGRFNTEPIADDAIFPVCSPQFAEKYSQVFIERFDGGANQKAVSLPLLHLENQGRGWPDWEEYLEFVGLEIPSKPQGPVFTTYDVCLEMASLGEGVALGWARSVKSKIDAGKLVRLPAPIMPLPDCIYVYLPRMIEPGKEVKSFVNLLRQSIGPIEK